ncbi:MAG: tRNA preQ1(34) S-adenosylmethionine ribosyltransferase-isomerase QueA [Rhodanobacter sp.]
MKKSDFDFDLPRELIAQVPLPERSASRLLLLDVPAKLQQDRMFRELPQVLRPGDLLVFNDTRVIPARLYGHKDTGGAVEIMIERVTGEHDATVQLGVSKKPKAGGRIELADGSYAVVTGREDDFFHLHFESPEPLEKLLLTLGEIPLPPYIERQPDANDLERYQTVYARNLGAVAAPTAGLHFDEPVLQALRERGVDFGYITLHVGAGTFQPVREDDIEDHHMHREWISVGAALVEQIKRTRAAGGRVIAVGTTVVRALESASESGELKPSVGETQIFIFPGYKFRCIDALITNFHLPKSTLLMLVSALVGRETMLAAYRHAVEERYRFFSYGDAMLILPNGL